MWNTTTHTVQLFSFLHSSPSSNISSTASSFFLFIFHKQRKWRTWFLLLPKNIPFNNNKYLPLSSFPTILYPHWTGWWASHDFPGRDQWALGEPEFGKKISHFSWIFLSPSREKEKMKGNNNIILNMYTPPPSLSLSPCLYNTYISMNFQFQDFLWPSFSLSLWLSLSLF